MPDVQHRSAPSATMVVMVLFFGTFATGTTLLRASGSTSWSGQPDQQVTAAAAFGHGAYTVSTPHLTLPKLMHQVEPKYTANALRAKVQGDVAVDVVVRTDGTVGDVQLSPTQPQNALHDYYYQTSGVSGEIQELQDEALKAAKDWTYAPGRLNGKAVPVIVTETLSFRIH